MPTYVEFKGPAPDLAGTAEGVQPAYVSYPKEPVKSVAAPPLKGGEASGFTNTVSAPPLPVEQNAAWQEVNKQLGGALKLTVVSSADYAAKLNTMIAGEDLPDMVYVNQGGPNPLPNLLTFLQAKMTDLTPFLAGDAVKDYPNLANIPPYNWKGPGTFYSGQIWGVPIPQPGHRHRVDGARGDARAGRRRDAQERRRLQTHSGDTDAPAGQRLRHGLAGNRGVQRLQRLCPDVRRPERLARRIQRQARPRTTKPRNSRPASALRATCIRQACFTRTRTPTPTPRPTRGSPAAGSPFSTPPGPASRPSSGRRRSASTRPPSCDRWRRLPPTAPARRSSILGPGNFGNTYLRKTTPERTRELLGVLNYLAAPFGTQEQMLLQLRPRRAPTTTWTRRATRPPRQKASPPSPSPGAS